MKYYNSPQMTEYSFAGIHLRPNNQFYYQQRTDTYNGIEIEETNSVIVRDLCGNELGDLQDYFEVVYPYQDENTGFAQLIWRIKENCPLDFGYQLVYLEINSGANAVCYSSPFMFTEDRAEYTSIWYYKYNSDDYMYSIGLQIYYKQPSRDKTKTSYTPISTGYEYTASVKKMPFEIWHTDIIEINILSLFDDIFLCNTVYSKAENQDGYPVLTSEKEVFDFPELEADENFTETPISLNRDKSITYDPYAIPIIPPAPTPQDPYIDLEVERVDNQTVRYIFSYGNFSPTELTLQRSLTTTFSDGGYTFSPPTSPRTYGAPDNNINNYYYRVIHIGTGTVSNLAQIPIRSLVIRNIVYTGTPRTWSVSYDINNFIIPQGRLLTFQSSSDGIKWSNVITSQDNNNPKTILLPISSPAQDRIRILYDPENIISNPVMLPS